MVLLVLAALSLFAVFVSATSTPPAMASQPESRDFLDFVFKYNQVYANPEERTRALPFCNEILPTLLHSYRIAIGQTAGVNHLGA